MLRMLSTATTVRKPGQSRKGFEQNGLRTGEDSAADQTSMFVIELVGGRPVGCAKCKTGFQAMIAHRGKDLALIGLERDEIIGAPFEDLADDRFLAAHRVQGHDAALEIQRVEQFRNGSNLVRLIADLALAEHQAPLARAGADDMQRALIAATVEGTAHRLAIDGDDLPIHANRKGLRPGCETTLKIRWVDQHEDTAEGVMGRNAVR